MSERPPWRGYVFGYGSLVAMREPLAVGGDLLAAVPGSLRGFGRKWGVAMNNWEAAPAQKHFVDPLTRQVPRVRVAFLDIEEEEAGLVNGLAVPVDEARLAALDAREVNYLRLDVSSAFEPALPHPVYTYLGTPAARARGRLPREEVEICASRAYLGSVREAFAGLGPGFLAEFERTTAPLAFPLRDLELVEPERPADATRER